MALKACKECNGKVSTKAATCPHCGARIGSRTSITTWVFGGMFAAVVGSCVMNGADRESRVSAAQAEREAAEAAKSPEQKAAEASVKAQRDREMNIVLSGAKLLKQSMKKPETFELKSAILVDGKTVCYEYEARNSFNDRAREFYVLSLTDKATGSDASVWNKRCADKQGTDYTSVRVML
ncbi:hypothetical protein [Delftia acidovorans]|nr:hypothetical protein [Delftia acidovorans]QPS76364.1 hypothetical protein I6G48_07375 [Delftia acidovorans]